MICLEGRLKSAGRLLLRLARTRGLETRYHGDFDWPGLQIANSVMGEGALPWRMSAADYRAAPDGIATSGAPVEACWDRDLMEAMIERGQAVHEESLLDLLLADLVGS